MARPKKTDNMSLWQQCEYYESRMAKLNADIEKLNKQTPKAVLNLVKKSKGLTEDEAPGPVPPPEPPAAKPNGKATHGPRAQA